MNGFVCWFRRHRASNALTVTAPRINQSTLMGSPNQTFNVDSLAVRIYSEAAALYADAVAETQDQLAQAIGTKGAAAAILATGNTQIEFLKQLADAGGVDWSKVTLFHMDEYLGIAGDHPASFRHYMKERVESLLQPKAFHYLQGDADEPIRECERYEALLRAQPIDLCMLGLGENGHLAFNDPHVANFTDERAVKIVSLDETCRLQQVKQGHFPDIHTMPQYALTITIPTLLSAEKVLCMALDERKQAPVKRLLQGDIAPECPATALRNCDRATLLLDGAAAAGL